MTLTNKSTSTVTIENEAHPRLWLGILGVTIALSAPVVQVLLAPWIRSTFEFPADRFVSLWVFWIALILALGIAHYGEGYSLATFGFRRSEKTLRARLIEWIFAVLAAMVVAVVLISFSGFIRSLLTDEPAPALDIVLTLPVWVLIPAWITGSFTEEVLFRSYSIERLTQITGRSWLAGLITLLAFTLFHWLTWDWIHVLTMVFPGGLLLTLLYLWRRSLAFVVIVHGIVNAPLLLLPLVAPYM
jgi:membrane protease YdiL (CAAX protease family)